MASGGQRGKFRRRIHRSPIAAQSGFDASVRRSGFVFQDLAPRRTLWQPPARHDPCASEEGLRRLERRQQPMPDVTDESELDNPVWSCLTTRHAHLARGGPLAARYPVEFSPLGGIPAGAPDNVEALQALVGVGEDLSVAGAHVPEMPSNWETQHRLRIGPN